MLRLNPGHVCDDLDRRLLRCFVTVFPEADPRSLTNAAMDSLEGWDSVALVILVKVIEEEFGFKLTVDSLSALSSFAAFSEYLHECDAR